MTAYSPQPLQSTLRRQAPPQRAWHTTRHAAALLGVAERTLRRRLQRSHWIEGLHYRWVTRNTRQTLEINVAAAIELMNRRGWV